MHVQKCLIHFSKRPKIAETLLKVETSKSRLGGLPCKTPQYPAILTNACPQSNVGPKTYRQSYVSRQYTCPDSRRNRGLLLDPVVTNPRNHALSALRYALKKNYGGIRHFASPPGSKGPKIELKYLPVTRIRLLVSRRSIFSTHCRQARDVMNFATCDLQRLQTQTLQFHNEHAELSKYIILHHQCMYDVALKWINPTSLQCIAPQAVLCPV